MKKTSATIAAAFLNGQKKTVSNTSTDGARVLLHGNEIARKEGGHLIVTLAGWNTPTTRERVNAILATFGKVQRVVCKKGLAYVREHSGHDYRIGDCENIVLAI